MYLLWMDDFYFGINIDFVHIISPAAIFHIWLYDDALVCRYAFFLFFLGECNNFALICVMFDTKMCTKCTVTIWMSFGLNVDIHSKLNKTSIFLFHTLHIIYLFSFFFLFHLSIFRPFCNDTAASTSKTECKQRNVVEKEPKLITTKTEKDVKKQNYRGVKEAKCYIQKTKNAFIFHMSRPKQSSAYDVHKICSLLSFYVMAFRFIAITHTKSHYMRPANFTFLLIFFIIITACALCLCQHQFFGCTVHISLCAPSNVRMNSEFSVLAECVYLYVLVRVRFFFSVIFFIHFIS